MKYKILVVLFFISLLYSCEKPAGLGGKGEIKGKVTVQMFDRHFNVLQSVFPADKKDVFIIYGDGETVSNDTETSPEGKFSFSYLNKGEYKIFVYSDGKAEDYPSGKMVIEKDVTLNSKDDVVDAGELIIFKTIDVTDGDATIKGQIKQINYSKDFSYIKDTTNAQEEPVYIFYEDYPEYIDRIRTLEDGTFAISNLIKGKYTILVYSENKNGSKEDVGIRVNTEVRQLGQTIELNTIFIAKN